MIDINIIRENPDKARKALRDKRIDESLVDKFLEVDQRWRALVGNLDGIRAEKKLVKQGEEDRGRELKEKAKTIEADLKVVEAERDILVEQFPNIPFDDVPVGKDETENIVVRTNGEKRSFDFEPKGYLSIAGDMIDTESASKVAGSRFGYILGDLALLEFALIKLAFDKLIPHGFVPVIPPVMAKPEVMKGMGKIKFIEGDDAFHLPKDDLYLVGSSEHSIGPMYMGNTIDAKNLPIRYVGFSTCFRREAGSYGKDTKGILRVHQFDKVEMFSFAHPDKSREEHDFLISLQEELMQSLGLHYQVVSICTGDMGFGDARQFDIETWLPGQGKYRETQSCSNVTDYQSRGLAIKYKETKGGENVSGYVHMLNGTAFAIPRMLIAIIENYQTKDGTIIVPEVLRNYVGKEEIRPKGDKIN